MASIADWFQSRESHLYCIVNREVGSQPNLHIVKGLKGWEKAIKGGYDLQKKFKVGPTSNYTVFRLPCGDKSSVQGFQFYVLKFFPLSKRIFEGFELVRQEITAV